MVNARSNASKDKAVNIQKTACPECRNTLVIEQRHQKSTVDVGCKPKHLLVTWYLDPRNILHSAACARALSKDHDNPL